MIDLSEEDHFIRSFFVINDRTKKKKLKVTKLIRNSTFTKFDRLSKNIDIMIAYHSNVSGTREQG